MELTGYAAATGERLWWAHGVTVFPTAPPFVMGDSVYTLLEEQVIATLAIADARIYVRTERHLYCFGSQKRPRMR